MLYDGACGFCRRFVRWWTPVLRRYGFQTAPLQTDWVSARFAGTPGLLDDIRVLTPAGESVLGERAYAYVALRIWWLWPVGVLLSLPGIRWLAAKAYRAFAANRHCIWPGPAARN